MDLIDLLALLACPISMGAMMWMMSRSHGSRPRPVEAEQAEIARLRAEVDRLSA